jgi:hypothetical protein
MVRIANCLDFEAAPYASLSGAGMRLQSGQSKLTFDFNTLLSASASVAPARPWTSQAALAG